jgi:hypothetical protein
MHAIKLNVADHMFDKFMDFVNLLPQNSIEIEEIDDVPYYPAISFKEAQQKVAQAIFDIDNENGVLISEEETFKILEAV